ncbi:zwei Ig domain protein zig-8-like isoform X1 [Penaeus indicus]|uniref:zwei Ig domain protein zig-8-like isoform X1 n=1 Tax=Penaeus indicus TaxID=29960 RepID=UPI00300C1EA8
MLTRSPPRPLGLVTLLGLALLTWPAQHVHAKALSFDPKKLESSSQLWWNPREVLSPSYEDTPQNVTALVGDSAFLPCTVSHLGDRSVTWMRQRDLHILTAGVYTYSADERFRVLHPENSDDWTLHIKYTTFRDSGVYECQVNSDPKISRAVTLTVKENQLDDPGTFGIPTTDNRFPDYIFDNYEREKKKRKSKKNKGRRRERRRKVPLATIEGPTERHIQQGSILAITCIVHHMPHSAPAHILWFHGPQNIDYDSPRGGVSIQTEKAARKTVSKLMLSTVTLDDTGEYSCAPSDLQPAVVNVHVQIGEETVGQIQQPVKQGPGLSGAAVTASVSSALLAMLLVGLACVKCRVFA